MSTSNLPSPNKRFSPIKIWAMSFGCSVGWGAFVMPGTMFLPMAGPVGTILALLLGALAMIVISANYNFMASRNPHPGGSYTYIREVLGGDHAYLCTWFLWLLYASILWANATALPLLVRNFYGDVLQFGFHYRLAGYDIYGGEVLLTTVCLILTGLLCMMRNRTAILLNTICGCFLFLAICALFIGNYVSIHSLDVISPAFVPNKNTFFQVFSIMALAPWAFSGFEAVCHVQGEINSSKRHLFALMSSGVFCAAIAYILLTLIAAMPIRSSVDWSEYTAFLLYGGDSTITLSMPIFKVIAQNLGKTGMTVLFLAVFCGVATALFGLYIALSRLTCAVADDGILPKWFAHRGKRNIPTNAILFIMIVSIVFGLFGRTTIGWIIDITTVAATLAYFYISFCVYKKAKEEKQTAYVVTGAVGIILSALLCLFIFMPSFWSIGNLATESYLLFAIWGVFGFLFFLKVFQKDTSEVYGRSTLVWLAMLFVIFLSTMLWMRQDVSNATRDIVKEVSEYYNTHTADEAQTPEEENAYLERQLTVFSKELIKHSLVQMTLIMVSMGAVFIVYSLLQSRRRKIEMEKAKAEEVSRSKSAFLSNMSHDIRTPMNAIIGFTTLALTKNDIDSVHDYLRKIELSSNHLLSLINDVLEMSRIESGKVEMQMSNVSIPELLHNLNTIIIGQIEAKQQNFDINAINIHDENIICDKLRLNQILLNLLSNAIKYTQAGGRIAVNVRQIDRNNERATYEFRIKDNGIGMSPEFAARIFEAFERENTSTVNKIQGTGLGMAITKHLVDLMGGTITLETEKGKGSEFIVTFTFEVVQGKKMQPPADLKGIHALVADDDYGSCDAITCMLSEMGMRVEWTMSGKEAILRHSDAAKRGDPYALCLIDWKMPDMSGVHVAREICTQKESHSAVILITAYDWLNIKEEAITAGVKAFCNKPVFFSELQASVLKALEHEVADVEEKDEEEAVNFEGKRILLVDDIEVNREIAVAILSMNGFEVDEAGDGAEAVEKVATAPAGTYDVILMDIQMPVMDGYAATQAIRALADSAKAQTPIVAMTANAFDEDKQAALDAGMNGHVAKPINIENLIATLKGIL